MHDARSATLARAGRLLRHTVHPAIHPERLVPEVEAFHVHGEPISIDEARAARFEPFPPGGTWGGRWDTTWFRLRAKVPEAWRGEEVAFRVSVGYAAQDGFAAEALVWGPRGPEQGLSRFHQEHVVACRADGGAEGGEHVELLLEAAANPEGPFASDRWPDLRPDYHGPHLYRLARAELTIVDRTVEAVAHDLQTVLDLATELTPDSAAGGRALAALAAGCAAIDPDDVRGSADAVRAALAPALSAPAAPGAHRIVATGHAHLDTAWLWPVRETVRKAARTFSSALRLMDEYPEYRFAASQPQQWAWVKEHYPELYERMVAKVAAGQLEPVGAMWVEADCNLPSGESLVRQIVHGMRFFSDELGVEPEGVWLPDVFGYPASLPGIMRAAGLRWFLTQKISWNDTNTFPHSTFWWEGIDGSRVLAHFPPADTYNGVMTVEQLRHSERNFKDHGRSNLSLYLYGFGDGGGGPTREMLEAARRLGNVDGVPRVELGRAADFFDQVERSATGLSTWVGELYFELHRGTYTTQARIKQANRRAELALRDAEAWSALAGRHDAGLDGLWKRLLLHQFHDVIPGSSIGWVYDDTLRDLADVQRGADAVTTSALQGLAGAVDTAECTRPVVLCNSLGHRRDGVVEVTSPAGGDVLAARVPDGREVAVQVAHDGGLLFPATVPSLGYATYELLSTPAAGPSGSPLGATPRSLTNGVLSVAFDHDGLITSIVDLRTDREVVEPGSRANVLQLLDDRPNNWDAWDIDRSAFDAVSALVAAESIEVIETGPHRASLLITRRFGASSLRQRVSLSAGSGRLDFVTDVDWHEDRKLLKAAFPVAIRSARATYEIQFGHVERPTHENTSWDEARFEVCAHRWADLSEAGYGVALLNDCKYGYDIRGNVMRLSLLRAPRWPDPHADRGHHRFTYSLLPHAGDLREAGVIDAAAQLNVPIRAVCPGSAPGGGLPPIASLIAVDRPSVVIDTVKGADDGSGLILRLHEAWGGRGRARIDCSGMVTALGQITAASRVDLLERPLRPLEHDGASVSVALSPFELATVRLVTGGDPVTLRENKA